MSIGLEGALGAAQARAEATLKVANGVTRELRKARTAAAAGQVRELRRALEVAAGLATELAAAAGEGRAAFDFDETAYLASGEYSKELLSVAAERRIAMFEEDERLLCYPSLVRVVPSDSAIEIDRRRERRLRPSVVVELLAVLQQRPPKFRADQFLESLASGYELAVARTGKKPDAVVRLTDVWAVLTLLPGQARDYTRPEFARDLYLLDQTGTLTTKGGRTLRWHASSGTRNAGVLTTVAQTGQQQRYWGVSFTAPNAR
ncbi:MAG TPA: hypothetical protein VNG13_07705 [Mycobacteriales bacterium]|nr:hypothetical protein [Mycobacteriales bacterium]